MHATLVDVSGLEESIEWVGARKAAIRQNREWRKKMQCKRLCAHIQLSDGSPLAPSLAHCPAQYVQAPCLAAGERAHPLTLRRRPETPQPAVHAFITPCHQVRPH